MVFPATTRFRSLFHFFFELYGHPRDLHSFPTRRSSDLRRGWDHRRPGVAQHPRRSTVDRKSTRLNSSHSQISYAVFCLKKKNNNKTTHVGTPDAQRCLILSAAVNKHHLVNDNAILTASH